MNSIISQFINNHQDEINTNDFFSVFTSAHSELSNYDCAILFDDLSQVFGEEIMGKSREAAFRFILTMAFDDLDPEYVYTFSNFINNVLAKNTLGYDYHIACEYIRQNQEEFDIRIEHRSNSFNEVIKVLKE